MKNLFKLLKLFFVLNIGVTNAQVGIGNVDPKSKLDISSSSITTPVNTDGLLVPRMNAFPDTNPGADQQSMLVYLTTDLTAVNISGTAQDYSKGFHFWDNSTTNWIAMAGAPAIPGSNSWNLNGNVSTDGGITDFLGTTDNQPVSIRTNNVERFKFTTNNQLEFINTNGTTFIGENAGNAYVYSGATDLKRNVFIGHDTGANYVGNLGAAFDNTNNTAVGANAMGLTTGSGGRNTAVGSYALENITGTYNVAVGTDAYNSATTANRGVAVGESSLYRNTTGVNNTAVGYRSMYRNTTGGFNVANGDRAFSWNKTGNFNVAIGSSALEFVDGTSYNAALGDHALGTYTVGVDGFNTAIGGDALSGLFEGERNTAIGKSAGLAVDTGSDNIFIGVNTGERTSGVFISGSLFIGNGAGTDATADNLMYLENSASATPLIGGDFTNDKVGINIDMSTPANLTHTLTVGGDVKAVDFEATASGTVYADYVFEDYYGKEATINKDYKFMPLNEVIGFVKENGHLPNVKSYKEVEANNFAISLTETSLKNLEKIEENFLYIAELKSENDKLKEDNLNLKNKLSKVEAQQAEILELLKAKQ